MTQHFIFGYLLAGWCWAGFATQRQMEIHPKTGLGRFFLCFYLNAITWPVAVALFVCQR